MCHICLCVHHNLADDLGPLPANPSRTLLLLELGPSGQVIALEMGDICIPGDGVMDAYGTCPLLLLTLV